MSRILLLSLILAGVCGCNAEKDPRMFLIPWADESGRYHLAKVTLDTLPDPFRLSGGAAQIYHQPGLSTTALEGEVVRPRLSRVGNFLSPRDVNSGVALAAYAVMERVQAFDRQLGIASRISWPRKIAVAMNIRSAGAVATDTAYYSFAHDLIAFATWTKPNLVAFALNRGVLAHEHFHAHFSSLGRRFTANWNRDRARKATGVELYNRFLLAAWNEGLSDLYATVFTGQSDFMAPSVPTQVLYRDLGTSVEEIQTTAHMLKRYSCMTERACPEISWGSPYIYLEGSRPAKVLYQWLLHDKIPKAKFKAWMLAFPSFFAGLGDIESGPWNSAWPLQWALANELMPNKAQCDLIRRARPSDWHEIVPGCK